MARLLMELAEVECRLASLAFGGGQLVPGARSLTRALYFLRLRAGEIHEQIRKDAGLERPEDPDDLLALRMAPRLC
jgi:hypothetical protein